MILHEYMKGQKDLKQHTTKYIHMVSSPRSFSATLFLQKLCASVPRRTYAEARGCSEEVFYIFESIIIYQEYLSIAKDFCICEIKLIKSFPIIKFSTLYPRLPLNYGKQGWSRHWLVLSQS